MAGSLLTTALRHTLAALALLLAVALVPATASAATTTLRPVIVSLTVTGPRPLPAAGARVVMTVRVRNATTCTFMRQYSTFSSLYPLKTVDCSSGHAHVVVPAIANIYKAPVHLTYAVRAHAGSVWVQRRVAVAQGAAAPPRTITPPPSPPQSTWAESPNWSGYVLPSTATFTEVAGTFTVPTLNCTVTPDGGIFTWVGIGGYGSSGTLLQTGVESDCVSGTQENTAWWEMFTSESNKSVDFHNFSVSVGDSITASVYQDSNGAWWTRLDDTTTGMSGWMQIGGHWGVGTDASDYFYYQGSSALLSYSGAYTAEWIVEDYTEPDSATMIPFADFGTVNFTGLQTSLSPWHLTANEGIAIAQNGVVLSTPSLPSSDGFSVSYVG